MYARYIKRFYSTPISYIVLRPTRECMNLKNAKKYNEKKIQTISYMYMYNALISKNKCGKKN